jgi:acyl-CoA thioesterase FadM
MAEWIETFRGVVSAWECDIVEHFTIAYYYEKLSDATRNLVELIGEGEALGPQVNTGPSRLLTTFQHELRAGAAFHITSAVTGVTGQTLALGHQVIDSTSGASVTWVAETLALPLGITGQARRKLENLVVPWPGPEVAPPQALPAAQGALTARDRVKPWEADERGRLTLSDHVHRFSGAGMHFLASVGMTSAYMHANRKGFSTFLLDIELISPARLGERVDVHTAAAHLGNTSMRYVHRMSDADGRPIASMVQAGVHLDLDARRPTPLPEAIRSAVANQLAKGN